MQGETGSRRQAAEARRRAFRKNNVDLAQFRYALRKFLRFSENAARLCGVTPQQHQLMLGVAGFTGTGSATISELAEFLQAKHHSVVGLVERAEESGLVRSRKSRADRRVVVVTLTRHGEAILAELSGLHHQQVERVRAFLQAPELRRLGLGHKDALAGDGRPTAPQPSAVRKNRKGTLRSR